MSEMGITINDKHSTEWGLHLKSMDIPLPEVKKNYVEIPGSSRTLDLSEVLTGFPTYSNRPIEFVFGTNANFEEWARLVQKISLYIHGKNCKIIVDTDPQYYYMARVEVQPTKTDRVLGLITIKGTAEPFKYPIDKLGDEWLWDPFNFDEDIIFDMKEIKIENSEEVLLAPTSKDVCPEFEIIETNNLSVTYLGKTYNLPEPGMYRFPDLRYFGDNNKLEFHGNGIVTIHCDRGVLG